MHGVSTEQKKGGQKASSVPRQYSTPIPVSLQKFPKVEVSFFLDRVAEMLKERSHSRHFVNLFTLYIEGVLS